MQSILIPAGSSRPDSAWGLQGKCPPQRLGPAGWLPRPLQPKLLQHLVLLVLPHLFRGFVIHPSRNVDATEGQRLRDLLSRPKHPVASLVTKRCQALHEAPGCRENTWFLPSRCCSWRKGDGPWKTRTKKSPGPRRRPRRGGRVPACKLWNTRVTHSREYCPLVSNSRPVLLS